MTHSIGREKATPVFFDVWRKKQFQSKSILSATQKPDFTRYLEAWSRSMDIIMNR
jgi:hypothetical protein